MTIATIYVYSTMPDAAGVSPGYPLGDAGAIPAGLVDINAYDPIPNAVFFNWVTVIVLAFGNICAIDFQARVMAAKDGKTAKWSCFFAGCVVMVIGGFFSANAGAMRALCAHALPSPQSPSVSTAASPGGQGTRTR